MRHRLAYAVGFAFVALMAAGQPAHAQRMPDMVTLDRGDGISRVGLDFAVGFAEDDVLIVQDGAAAVLDAALRFEVFGQYVSRGGFGVYGALPISHLLSDGDDEAAIGNVDVGGLFVQQRRTHSFVFRAGLALPTAADDLDGFLTNVIAGATRLTDLALVAPDTTYLRLSFSPLYHANQVFLRLDLGADVVVNDDDDSVIDPPTIFRANLGGGFDLGAVALMAELVNLASSESFDDDGEDDEDFLHTFALSARFMGGDLQPYLSFGVPLDDAIDGIIDFFVGAGLQLAY